MAHCITQKGGNNMNIEFEIVHSKNAAKPTLLLVLPFKDAIQDEMKEEIGNFLQKTDEIIELKEEHRERIQDLGDYIRNIVGSKKVYGIDISMEDCDSDDERLFEKNGTTDWLFILSRIISEYPGFRDVDNHAFRVALEETLFAALLGAAAYIGGKIKSIDSSSMVGIYYRKRGMCWLSYPTADMKIYLKKGMYNEVDGSHNIIYSEKMDGLDLSVIEDEQFRSTTFGNYPYYSVDMYDPIADAEFVLELIKYAKDH